MSENLGQLYVIAHESEMDKRRQARDQLLRTAITGKGMDVTLLARARGMVVREEENSIFSEAWLPLAIIFLLIGVLSSGAVFRLFAQAAGFGDAAVAPNRPLVIGNAALIALGFTLLLTVAISRMWKNVSLLGVTYERQYDRTRVFPGEPIHMTITITNDKPLPLTWVQFRDSLPKAIEEDSHALSHATSQILGRYSWQNTFSLAGYEQLDRQVSLRFLKRGFYTIGPVTYESGDIFTLFTIRREHAYLDRLIVYPQIYPLGALGLPAKEPFGELKVTRSLFTDPIKTQGIRDYQPGDRFRDVHWKATAVRGSLQTKVYDPSTGMSIAVFLNVATYAKHWMGFDPEQLERAVSVAGSVANYGMQQGWAVGLYANGSMPNADQPIRVPPGRSPDQLAHILEALAAVTEFGTGTIEKMMLRESTRLPWASTMVLVTAVVTEEIMVGLMRLKEAGRRVVLISLAAEPPPKGLGTVLAYHIPASAPAFQKGIHYQTATEAALSSIPAPAPVGIEFELEDTT